ncbi:MAG TPA: class I SAM-dependent methyltransferase, partial [Elusimicrobiales bacterium]|nr:class I SAM-dependent methyltransferase [Elusimicrobiales bacterium]
MGELAWAPNGNNLWEQLTEENFDAFQKAHQNVVLYEHWGCHHKDNYAYTPQKGEALGDKSKAAFLSLAEAQKRGEVRLQRLACLLGEEAASPFLEQAQRIGCYSVRAEKSKEDNFYYNQYNKRDVSYCRKRLEQLGAGGGTALDAGCGVGQWAFAMAGLFQHVDGVELNEVACEYLGLMTANLRQKSPVFRRGNIEALPYDNGIFDFIFCYSVIMFTDVEKSLREFFRVMKAGGSVYICLNADGWYEYCCEERFADNSEQLLAHCQPLWHALYYRLGGEDAFLKALRRQDVAFLLNTGRYDSAIARGLLRAVIAEASSAQGHKALEHYSPAIIDLLGRFVREYLLLLQAERGAAGKVRLSPFYSVFASVRKK